jgi:hypothetical protein
MSSWNFRLIRWACGTVALHEAYYDDDGRVTMVTQNPIDFLAHDEEAEAAADEIRRELGYALNDATRLPILDCDEIPGCAGRRLSPTTSQQHEEGIQKGGDSLEVESPDRMQPNAFVLRVGAGGLEAAFAEFADVWKRAERGERVTPSIGVSYPNWDALKHALHDAGLESAERAIVTLQSLASKAMQPDSGATERQPPPTLYELLAGMPPREPGLVRENEPHDLVGRARHWARIAAAEAPGNETAPEDTLWWALAEEIVRLQQECAEAYQVIGAFAAAADVNGGPNLIKVLDNLAAAANGKPRQHPDVLPFIVPDKE